MPRISGQNIDIVVTEDRVPIPHRIKFYVDGYASNLASRYLYEIADAALYEHFKNTVSDHAFDATYDKYYSSCSYDVRAELLAFAFSILEMHVVRSFEKSRLSVGSPLYPNALLVNETKPFDVEIDKGKANILDALYPLLECEFESKYYIDISSTGKIYAPKKIDIDFEKYKIRKEIKKSYNDSNRVKWLEANFKALDDGKFIYQNRDGSFGTEVDFRDSEYYYTHLASKVGSYSAVGETKMHWSCNLRDLGEKGVDCDLIINAMDDLYNNSTESFVFMTNDMDFFPLIERIKSDGKNVFLCGIKGKVSNRLIKCVGEDNFFNLDTDYMKEGYASVLMSLKESKFKEILLQWAWLKYIRQFG